VKFDAYGMPTWAVLAGHAVIANGWATMIFRFLVDEPPRESVTRTRNENVPATLGVPCNCPDAASSVTPAGNAPLAIDQV
jgi:hypothetical protein